MPQFDFDTGPSTLPDVGDLSYNDCLFSPMFQSKVTGNIVQDEAGRTTKWIDYVLEVEGVVTLPDGQPDITVPMTTLRELLTQQAGTLMYQGRGLNLAVNVVGGPSNLLVPGSQDVAWGPIPKLLEFTPLGGGRSAMVKWRVQTRVVEQGANSGVTMPVLQFNFETAVGCGEDGYSTLDLKGTLEIPLTRPAQGTRTLTQTVDDFRQNWITQLMGSIDLTRFRVTRRDFPISRDRRTMQFHVTAEELPPQGLPAFCTVATGNFSFAPAKQGMGLCTWFCTLRVSYNVAKNQPRRTSWLAFLLLLRMRMAQSVNGNIAGINANDQNPQNAGVIVGQAVLGGALVPQAAANWRRWFPQQNNSVNQARKAWIIDLRCDEGLYLGSRVTTWSASWRLTTTFSHILVASGIWKYLPTDGGNTWSASVQAISGWRSWLSNRVDPAQDFIVDFGASG